MRGFYQISIIFYRTLIQIVAPFNPKAKLWVEGRKQWKEKLKAIFSKQSKVIWFHAASLGEFEQARPLIEKIKKEQPGYFVLLTFFSPSGYEVRKNYQYADHVCYLPADTKQNAKIFLDIVKPEKVFFVKYEFWFNFLSEIKHRSIPNYLVSGIFRPSQIFFKWYGSWFENQLKAFDWFFVQNETSKKLLNSIGYTQVTVTGDTRLDSVSNVAKMPFTDAHIEQFISNRPCMVVGSSWPQDEQVLKPLFNKFNAWCYIIAPHEVNENRLKQIEKHFENKTVRYSKNTDSTLDKSVLIIDSIGSLSKIYRYAKCAYVGGAFKTGLHNVLEPAVYGMPVIFGPQFEKFQEAKDLIHLGAAKSINSSEALISIFQALESDQKIYNQMSQATKRYVEENLGAVQSIYEAVFN
ncbi:MAG: 3-deoxy-D-manno-octulosonic acid transferase [Bacteroidales bacterium]|nr:3-deoxy-D-manno-octulosonic acid transferase [Bacteroidales bacterium]